MLTDRQKLTITHINHDRTLTPEEIVRYCQIKMEKPHRKSGVGGSAQRRRHSKKYYWQIIEEYIPLCKH